MVLGRLVKVKAITLDNTDPRNVTVDINITQGINITTATLQL